MATRDIDLNVRHDEPNLARLNLILAPNRTELYEWSRDIVLDALGGVKIVCTSPRGSLVPHGVDNDILLGLVNAAVLQGLPEDDTVKVSTRELLKLSGITPSARSYDNLKESLRRLQHTAYDVTDSWYDGSKQRWRSMSFSLIVKHWAEDKTADVTNIGRWRAQTLLAIKLDDGLIRNIRAGHILLLDFELLSHLTQPLTRNVFRTLSFQRNSLDQRPTLAFSIPLTVWAVHLGMHDMRLDTVMRALKPAHAELLETGFLSEVTYQGRGRERTVTYVFAKPLLPTSDPEAVALLTKYGISGGRALTLAQTHGVAVIQRAVSVLEALLQSAYRQKIRNRAGILSDILASPDKYDSILTQEEEIPSESTKKKNGPTRPPSSEEAVAPLPRTAKAAHVLLTDQFNDTVARRDIRDQATALYIEGRISSLDLISLQGKDEQAVAKLLTSWRERSLQS